MTVPRPSIKGQKVSGGPVPATSAPFPKQLEYSSHSTASEITQPYKNAGAFCLLRWTTVCGECISLNKCPFTLLRLYLEFFPAGTQEPSLGSYPRDSDVSWDVTVLSCPTLLPAATVWWIFHSIHSTSVISRPDLSVSFKTSSPARFKRFDCYFQYTSTHVPRTCSFSCTF